MSQTVGYIDYVYSFYVDASSSDEQPQKVAPVSAPAPARKGKWDDEDEEDKVEVRYFLGIIQFIHFLKHRILGMRLRRMKRRSQRRQQRRRHQLLHHQKRRAPLSKS